MHGEITGEIGFFRLVEGIQAEVPGEFEATLNTSMSELGEITNEVPDTGKSF